MDRIDKIGATVSLSFFAPYIPIFWLVTAGIITVLADVYSACKLAQRVKRKGLSTGKLKTESAKKVMGTLMDFFLLILISWIIDVHVLTMVDTVYLPNYATLIFCGLQTWSFLENTSSCNGATWAKVMQKILIDKSERHYDINLQNLKNEENGNKQGSDKNIININ